MYPNEFIKLIVAAKGNLLNVIFLKYGINFLEIHETYGIVKYGNHGFSSFSLDAVPLLEWMKACNLLRMILKIRSNGYPLSKRILIM